MSAEVTIIGKARYSKLEVLRILQLAEDGAGKKMRADIQELIDGEKRSIEFTTEKLSNKKENLAGLVEEIAASKQAITKLEIVLGFFDEERLNKKFNQVSKLERQEQEEQLQEQHSQQHQ